MRSCRERPVSLRCTGRCEKERQQQHLILVLPATEAVLESGVKSIGL